MESWHKFPVAGMGLITTLDLYVKNDITMIWYEPSNVIGWDNRRSNASILSEQATSHRPANSTSTPQSISVVNMYSII